MKKLIIGLIVSTIVIILFWPAGIACYIFSALLFWKENSKGAGLESQINLIAKQLGIEYGTPEEKLEQIATLAARAGAETRK